LEAGSEVNKHYRGETALFHAVYTKCPEDQVDKKVAVINLLLDTGADACAVIGGKSVLHACISEHVELQSRLDMVIDVLLSRCPALLHCRDSDGATALMVLSRGKCPSLIRKLLDAGADPMAKDNRNKSAMWYLFSDRDSWNKSDATIIREALLMLLSSGADPTVCSNRGETILMRVLSLAEKLNGAHEKPVCSDAVTSAWLGDILDAVVCRAWEDATTVSHSALKAQGKLRQAEEEEKRRDEDTRAAKRGKRWR
jgi:hypothetical protein